MKLVYLRKLNLWAVLVMAVCFLGALHIHGMNAVGRNAKGIVATDRGYGAKIGTLYPGYHDQPYAGPHCSFRHRGTVAIKLESIQMTVGVDQHHSLHFVDPRLLYRFELLFAAVTLVFLETRQRHDPTHQVDKIDARRINLRMRIGKRNGDIKAVGPFHFVASAGPPQEGGKSRSWRGHSPRTLVTPVPGKGAVGIAVIAFLP